MVVNYRITKKNGQTVDYNGADIFDVLEQYVVKFPTVLPMDLFDTVFSVFKPTTGNPKGLSTEAIEFVNYIVKSADNKIVSFIYGFTEVEFD